MKMENLKFLMKIIYWKDVTFTVFPKDNKSVYFCNIS